MLKNLVALLSILAFAGVAFANTAEKKTETTTEVVKEHHKKEEHTKKHDEKHHEKMTEIGRASCRERV